jgi:hypothetical protein
MSRVAPTKGNLVVGARDESMVGDGHAMSVTAEILEHVLWATERWFCIDHPILSEQWSQPGSESLRQSERCQIPREAELAVPEGALETSNELAAKNATEHPDGKKEPVGRCNPQGVIGRQSTGRNDTVDMRMKLEFLVPGMQHAEEADLGTEMSGIAGDFEKCFCTGPEQQTIEDLGVL